ncbi:hypothetical protein GCM10027053_54280 [Intrasporangium mesophilum]
MSTTTRRRLSVAAALAALAIPAAVAGTSGSATASTASAPYCGITWGSLPKATSPAMLWTGAVAGVRSGQHTCFDRVVFDIAAGGGKLGYNVRYVSTVTMPGSGLPVALTGGAKIQITVNAPSTLGFVAVGYTGWRTFRQLKNLGSFEGYTDFGLGVRARLPMRVFTVTNTDGSKRLVVDVANAW